jgi:hypothetical protein
MMPILIIPLAGQEAVKREKIGSLRAISVQMIPYISGPASKAVGKGGCGQVYLSYLSLAHRPQMRNHDASSSFYLVSHLGACQQRSESTARELARNTMPSSLKHLNSRVKEHIDEYL